ncbi:1-acyl-sn-glycerol-3-phosphate acyltransferase [Streptomyces sp. HNM0574]|nr:lysophospholipid acyltransferase family protein [Streptomyces sp. HNM0574]NLU66864.1 1-acyl-sn-glycerol-3-phosphate acyltransferase [Streptomyces sp. HNM0574]
MRRYAAFAATVAGVLARPGRLDTDPVRLSAAARAVLAALAVTLDAPEPLPEPRAADAPGTLIVANHVSWLDVVALLAVAPAPLLAKREVGDWPVVGPLARRAGTRFIDRDGLRRLPRTVADVTDHLRTGAPLVVFPQGTTWCSAPGGAFRRATFEAALRAGAPVRPVALVYTRDGRPTTAPAFVGDDAFLPSLHRVARTEGLTVHVRTGPLLAAPPPGPAPQRRRALAAAARQAVAEAAGRVPVRSGAAGAAVPTGPAAAVVPVRRPVPGTAPGLVRAARAGGPERGVRGV